MFNLGYSKNRLKVKHYINLFSPETYQTFSESDRTITGFRIAQKGMARKISPSDRFICYVTKLSRWVGVLEVAGASFVDDSPIFVEANDPFTVRFNVKVIVWLDLNNTIPIHEDLIWDSLSFTQKQSKHSSTWTGALRGSLREMNDSDAAFLENLLLDQVREQRIYLLSDEDKKKLNTTKVRIDDRKEVSVSIPEDDNKPEVSSNKGTRESLKIQAILAKIGARMNLKIWLPRSDRNRVLEVWKPEDPSCVLESLPLNYNDSTLKTIENIDVIWIKGSAIIRAF